MTNNVTNNKNELSLGELYETSCLEIPSYQRPYASGKKETENFYNTIVQASDKNAMARYLGVLHARPIKNELGKIPVYEVVDGQQRSYTYYLFQLALVYVYALVGLVDFACEIYKRIIAFVEDGVVNLRIGTVYADDDGLYAAIGDLANNKALVEKLGEYADPIINAKNALRTGRVYEAYKRFVRRLSSDFKAAEAKQPGSGLKFLSDMYFSANNKLHVVPIVLKESVNPANLFCRLDYMRTDLNILDLVRANLIDKALVGGKAAVEDFVKVTWNSFTGVFKDTFANNWQKAIQGFFYPYVLTLKSTVDKNGAYAFLEAQWEDKEPREIVDEMRRFAEFYCDLRGKSSLSNLPADVKKKLNDFALLNPPSTCYSFVMSLLAGVQDKLVTARDCIKILDVLESFFVRRSICRIEPTGLHQAFRALWTNCAGIYTAEMVEARLRNAVTVQWPGDEEVMECVRNKPLYGAKIVPFILARLNASYGGDIPVLNNVQVEHVLPQTPSEGSGWCKDWTSEEHSQYKNCLGNLLPCSQTINGSLQASDYAVKRERYRSDSALRAPRAFAEDYEHWTPVEFHRRSQALAKWIVDTWKY